MQIQKRPLGNTYVTQAFPWGLYLRNGHRLLCSDGKIRAAELAVTADTFFSVPATIRVKGKTISGYMSTMAPSGLDSDTPRVYVFRAHSCHYETMGNFPTGEALETLINSAL